MVCRGHAEGPGVRLCVGLHHLPELDPGADLHPQHQGGLQQDALQPLDADVVHGPRAEPAERRRIVEFMYYFISDKLYY